MASHTAPTIAPSRFAYALTAYPTAITCFDIMIIKSEAITTATMWAWLMATIAYIVA
ncbi:hypothetical protein AO376_0639 [Moraxella catarrhalis]|nr:hypothetical protein AO376_0639 [Moraxella catarrhalis]OAV20859.1 hypothetical protein AO374_0353 [Moraxella catarrhalis]